MLRLAYCLSICSCDYFQQASLTLSCKSSLSVAVILPLNVRQDTGIYVFSQTCPISCLASTHLVSQTFTGDRAQQALNELCTSSQGDYSALFPSTHDRNWLYQLSAQGIDFGVDSSRFEFRHRLKHVACFCIHI